VSIAKIPTSFLVVRVEVRSMVGRCRLGEHADDDPKESGDLRHPSLESPQKVALSRATPTELSHTETLRSRLSLGQRAELDTRAAPRFSPAWPAPSTNRFWQRPFSQVGWKPFPGPRTDGIGQTVADHHQVDIAGGGVVALGDRSIVEAPPGIAEENRQDTLLYLGEQSIGQTREGNRPLVTARPARMLLDGLATRYSTRMKVTIDLSPAQTERLRQEAERLGLTPEDLARAAVADLLATRDDDFEAAARRVLQKNQELYRRLA
jgi:hypothetical protein